MPDSAGKRFKPTKYIPVCTAATLLVGSTTLFLVFTCPWLSNTVSPLVPLYNGVVLLFVLANFSMATFMDPGVYPRASEDEDKDEDFRAPLYKNVEVKGIQVRMKWCATCHFYRPPRCSHCSVCDNCVEDFDHHCPWVNNCIGRRNYRYFFLFLLSLSVHMLGVFSFGLIYVLHHLERLAALHTVVTMVVMCITGLFFIPVMGLTGFHMVLVARGRTTNEQVTGKFRGGVNPFTRGCCGNVKHVLCSPQAPRYLIDPRKKPSVPIEPPFLRPALTDRSVTVKVSDNGVHANMLRSKSKTSLDTSGEKSSETQPPLPPKAERHHHHHLHPIQNQLTSSEESSISSKPTAPSTPAMYQFRPSFGTMPKVQYHATGEKLATPEDCKTSPILEERAHDYRSEPNLDLPDYSGAEASLRRHFLSSPFQLDSYSLRSSGRRDDPVKLGGAKPDSATSTPHRGVFSPGTVSSRNGSLSYDSLLTPSVASVPSVPFHSPYLPPKTCHARRPEFQRQAYAASPYCPVRAGFMYPRERERDPSPVRYDNLSETIMASIQERKELEEREKLIRRHGGHAHAQMYADDSGVFDAHCPAYRGSRDELSQVGVLSYGPRVHHASASSLIRAHAASTSSLHAADAGNGRGGQYRSPSHQPPPSPSSSPRSPSFTHQKLSYVGARAVSPHLGSREDSNPGKVNGHPKGQPRVMSPSGAPLSPGRNANIKKVTGVGGTTYEISV
ncbi:palmitoyltransferase ZDHHC8B [Trichomycterus rosablanca]|uniref:palmitoyltransferase ZDHHC8B n=1 Tax=Trichomycterus rosablanca TaxID=2290929 RepID=UPI002F358DD1